MAKAARQSEASDGNGFSLLGLPKIDGVHVATVTAAHVVAGVLSAAAAIRSAT